MVYVLELFFVVLYKEWFIYYRNFVVDIAKVLFNSLGDIFNSALSNIDLLFHNCLCTFLCVHSIGCFISLGSHLMVIYCYLLKPCFCFFFFFCKFCVHYHQDITCPLTFITTDNFLIVKFISPNLTRAISNWRWY